MNVITYMEVCDEETVDRYWDRAGLDPRDEHYSKCKSHTNTVHRCSNVPEILIREK